jgi:hypothetical protein
MFPKLPTFEEVKKDKKIIKNEYEKYLKVLSIKDINIKIEKIFELYKFYPDGYKYSAKDLFSVEKEDFVDPLNNGFPLIQHTDLLHYIMKVRDILEIEYKCQNCVVKPICCDYDRWMANRMYDQCDGVEILSDKFMCFIARKYIFAE